MEGDDRRIQMEEGFSEAVVDGMTGFIFTTRFETIHNPQEDMIVARIDLERYTNEEASESLEVRGGSSV